MPDETKETMMKTRTILRLVLAGSVAVSFAAAAGVPNPDNDSGTYFANKLATTSPAARSANFGVPANGTISEDGLYVWKNPDKGWVARGHSFVYAGGGFEHAPDCLAYNLPRSTGGRTPAIGAGS